MKKIFILTIMFCIALTSSAQNRSTLIHMKSGEIKELDCNEIDSITFTDAVEYDIEFTANLSMGIYYGNGGYLVQVSNAAMSEDGLPTEAGQYIFRIFAYAENSIDPRHAILPSGRYVSGSNTSPGTLYNAGEGYTSLLVCNEIKDGEPVGYMANFEDAVANVEYFSNGTYKIDLKGIYKNEDNIVRVQSVFNGTIDFDCQDPSVYDLLTEDVVMQPNYLTGNYTSGNSGDFSLVFFNCEIDKDFFIVGPGELLNLELFVEPGKPMDINKLAGEYVVQSMPNIVEGTEMQQPGHFGSGMMYEYYGRFIPIGSYYTTYVENGAEGKIKGLATGGTVKVTIDGDMLTFDVDLEVEGGHHVTMNYTHDASMIADYSGYGAPRKVVENKSCFIPIRSKVNVMHPAGAIRCIKK